MIRAIMLSLTEAFKRALFERIEDEYDITVAEEAYKDYLNSGCKTTPVEDFWRELDEEELHREHHDLCAIETM